jgi:hypothetical protein
MISREEGEGAREAKGRSFQPVQAYGTGGGVGQTGHTG